MNAAGVRPSSTAINGGARVLPTTITSGGCVSGGTAPYRIINVGSPIVSSPPAAVQNPLRAATHVPDRLDLITEDGKQVWLQEGGMDGFSVWQMPGPLCIPMFWADQKESLMNASSSDMKQKIQAFQEKHFRLTAPNQHRYLSVGASVSASTKVPERLELTTEGGDLCWLEEGGMDGFSVWRMPGPVCIPMFWADQKEGLVSGASSDMRLKIEAFQEKHFKLTSENQHRYLTAVWGRLHQTNQ